MKNRIIAPFGGYRRLDVFTLATIIQLETLSFCRQFLNLKNDPKGRLYDQMTQAARSGRANIIEGSERGGTSTKDEIRLTDVARASIAELMGDYEIWLLDHGFAPWDSNSPDARAVAAIRPDTPPQWNDILHDSGIYILTQRQKFARWVDSGDSIVAANALLLLCKRVIVMLNSMIQQQIRDFEQTGGFAERMYNTRMETRKLQNDKATKQ